MPSKGGGVTIPEAERNAYDFARLERAVATLVARHREVLRRHGQLREQLGERDRRIRALEAELLESNQRRKDVIKRIDDLIAQLDHLDGQLSAEGP